MLVVIFFCKIQIWHQEQNWNNCCGVNVASFCRNTISKRWCIMFAWDEMNCEAHAAVWHEDGNKTNKQVQLECIHSRICTYLSKLEEFKKSVRRWIIQDIFQLQRISASAFTEHTTSWTRDEANFLLFSSLHVCSCSLEPIIFSSNFCFDVADHHFNTINLALVFSPRKRRSRCDRHRGDRRRSRCDRQRGDRRRSGCGGCFDFLQFIDALLDSCNIALVISFSDPPAIAFFASCAYSVMTAIILRGAKLARILTFVVIAHNLRGANLASTLSFVVIAHKLRGANRAITLFFSVIANPNQIFSQHF